MIDSVGYCEVVAAAHRKEFGQFFTNSAVAKFMVDWVLDSGTKELYDPAFGLGAFQSNNSQIRFSASEIDPVVLDYCQNTAEIDLSSVSVEDYLTSWGKRHSNIVCNPPYMRFQKFLNRKLVFEQFKQRLNLRLSGYTNTASAFLLKSLSELDGNGRLSYVMPLEFLNAGYGGAVKAQLLDGGHLYAIISLECEKDIFPDATTSVGIVLYDAAMTHSKVSFYSLRNLQDLTSFDSLTPTNQVDVEQLNPKAKWLPYFQANKVSFHAAQMVPLNYYGRFSRGIATGANEYFVLSPSRAKSLSLAVEDSQPCITRSSQVVHPIFRERDLRALLDADMPMLLFCANGSASAGARKYISHGESLGYHERFLTKHRNPWYKTELRFPAPLLLGVFSRGGYKIILNQSKAVNLTCYHGFQPNMFGTQYVNHLFLYFLSQSGRSVISLSMRKYGDALDKFEPNDLNSAFVPTPEFFDSISTHEIESGMEAVMAEGAIPPALEARFAEIIPKKAAHTRVAISADSLGT